MRQAGNTDPVTVASKEAVVAGERKAVVRRRDQAGLPAGALESVDPVFSNEDAGEQTSEHPAKLSYEAQCRSMPEVGS